MPTIDYVLTEIELMRARTVFAALTAMDTDDLDGPEYCAWCYDHNAAWQQILTLSDKLRNMV